MANKKDGSSHKSVNKGAWSAEEDRILAQHIERHGPRRWKSVAIQSGLNRCGKSCRLRWLNYLRPDIKRGNICDAEEDLILRLHRLLGNRWSLIARRLPGRTDNEIKNHWNAHLRKKAKLVEKLPAFSTTMVQSNWEEEDDDDDEGSNSCVREEDVPMSSGGDDQELTSHHHHHQFFDFSPEGGTHGLDWVKSFLELEEDF